VAGDVRPRGRDRCAGGDSAEAARSVLRVIDALDELDDVQDVYANFDIPDELMEL
jgi:transcriptional/translational regulatory protein YebC/TACO1